MSKVLLIYPRPNEIKKTRFGYSLELLYIATILKDNHDIIYLDFSCEKFVRNNFFLLVNWADVIVVEFDVFSLKRSTNINHGEELIEIIRKINTKAMIICIGKDLRLFPRLIPGSDVCCIGESEEIIQEVLEILLEKKYEKIHDMRGVYLKVNDTVYMRSGILFIDNLDSLPLLDRSLLPEQLKLGMRKKSALVETSRGCGSKCSFCQRKFLSGGHVRTHTYNYILREFESLRENGFKNIWITDDNFTYNLNRAKEVLSLLQNQKLTKHMKIALSSWVNIDKEFLEIAKFAGVSIISFGIESTNKEILKFYKKYINLKKVRELIFHANYVGIYIVGNFIIGAPMETEETITETFLFAEEVPFDQVNIKILNYMAGSDLYKMLPSKFKNERTVFACRENGLNNFELDDLKSKIRNFKKKFYRSRKNKIKEKILKFNIPYLLDV
ncbi:MAG: radical SAM protein [Candidatus Hydrogenedens sp.]|nr:radical SAM protein [Candidatus Hydrogenedens sp.]